MRSTGHNLKLNFEILARERWDSHCKIKETLLIRDLEPSPNENVSREKRYLFWFACVFFYMQIFPPYVIFYICVVFQRIITFRRCTVDVCRNIRNVKFTILSQFFSSNKPENETVILYYTSLKVSVKENEVPTD